MSTIQFVKNFGSFMEPIYFLIAVFHFRGRHNALILKCRRFHSLTNAQFVDL